MRGSFADIDLDGNEIVFRNNDLQNCRASINGNNNLVQDNTWNGPGDSFSGLLSIAGRENQIISNNFDGEGVGSIGLYINGPQSTIRENEITGCLGYSSWGGALTLDTDSLYVVNNTIYQNAFGIHIDEGNSIVIDSCAVFENGIGIGNYDSGTFQNITIRHCDIYQNTGSGLDFDGILQNSRIDSCQIFDNNSNGIAIGNNLNSNINITNNSIYGNLENGVYCGGDSLFIQQM